MSASTTHNPAELDAPVVGWRYVVAGVVGLLVLGVVYGPLLVEFGGWQWSRPHYQFYPFVLLAVAGLLAHRWWIAPRRSPIVGTVRATLVLVGISWLLLLGAVWVHSPLAAAVSAIVLAAAGFRELGRRWHITYLWGIWTLLLLILPLPVGLDRKLITQLQLASSWLSSLVLDGVGVLHVMEGNSLSLADKNLFVDETCSGIISLLSIVSAAAIVGVWWNRPPLHVVALAIGGTAWATLLNVVRISLIAILYEVYGIDWSAGTPHEMLSLVLFGFAFAALLSTDQLLLGCITTVSDRWEEWAGQPLRFGAWWARLWDALVVEPSSNGPDPNRADALAGKRPAVAQNAARPMAWPRGWVVAGSGAFLTLAALQWSLFAATPDDTDAVVRVPEVSVALSMDGESMPQSLGDATLTGYRSDERETKDFFGQYSKVYEYRDSGSRQVTISCDFAFPGGWHELSMCYQLTGWEMMSREVLASPDRQGDNWPVVESTFLRPDGMYAAVQFCEFGAAGEPVEPPGGSLTKRMVEAFTRRQARVDHRDVFQVQLLIVSPIPLTDERLQQGRTWLAEMRERFRDHIVQGSAADPQLNDAPSETNEPK